MASAQILDEVTECSICTEMFTDPRVLPCVHTYCLKCIESYGINKKPGDKLSCPLCRKEFVVPNGGLAELPKNFFVNKLLHVKEIATAEPKTPSLVCDVCNLVEWVNKRASVATSYCIECQDKLCASCAVVHKNLKSCQSHATIAIGEKLSMERIFTSFPPPPCGKHSKDLLRFYCFDCKQVICMTCYIEVHSSHKCSDANSLIADFQNEISKDVNSIAAGVDKCQSLLGSISNDKSKFISQAAQVELDINSRTDELKLKLDHNRDKLVSDLQLAKEKRLSEVEGTEEEIKQHVRTMEGFTSYATQLQEKGSAFELAYDAAGLHNKAEELLMLETIGQAAARLSHVNLCLQPTTLATDDGNLIGEVVLLRDFQGAEVMPSTPTLTEAVSIGQQIFGITVLGTNIFVIRLTATDVSVYDSTTFKLQHTITVQASDPRGIVSCPRYNCLYVSSIGNNNYLIHRVELATGNATMKWKTDKQPFGLSINSICNVLVACNGTNKLQEFSTFGILIREIVFQGDVSSPVHAMQISNGQYVVSHGSPYSNVSIIGVDGKVVHNYGNSQQFGAGPLNYAQNIAICKNGCVMVADTNNRRILAMNPTLSCAHEMPFSFSVQPGLQCPFALCYEESQGRLYVGESTGSRLLVFDDVKNVGVHMKLS